MNLTEFIQSFADCFSEKEANSIKPETKFRKLAEWNSMMALIVISHIDEKFNLILTADDIRSSNTVLDLFNKLNHQ